MTSQESERKNHSADDDVRPATSNRAVGVCLAVGIGLLVLVLMLPYLDRM